MTLQEILNIKGSQVFAIDESATLDDVAQKLVACNCGSLVVTSRLGDGPPGRMVGIVTERDILRACAARRAPLDESPLAETMNRDVITAVPGSSVDDAMQMMTERRIRHLPIVEHGELLGMVSIGDVVKALHEQALFENHYLKTYIQS